MKQIFQYYVRVASLLFPLVFIPIILDPYGMGKLWFFMLTGLIGLGLWGAKVLVDGKGIIKFNKYFWLAFIFVVWSLIGWWRLPLGARMASFMSPFGIGMAISLLVWMFLWIQAYEKGEFKTQVNFMSVSGFILIVLSVVSFLIPNSRLPINWPNSENPLISINQGWSLAGSVYAETVLFLVLGVEFLKRLLSRLKKKEKYIVEAVLTGIFGLAFLLGVYKIIIFEWLAMDFFSAWNIVVETLKGNVIKGSTIFGVGMGNFLTAFNLFRPASYNLTKYWANTFSLSSVGILHLWTETGIVGLILIIWGAAGIIRRFKQKDMWMIVLMVVLTLLLPINPIVLFLLFWLLVYKTGEIKESKMVLYVGEHNFNVLPYVVIVALAAGIVFGGYWQVRVFLGDMTMRKALVAAAKNDGTSTYNLEIKAITYNPYQTNYRRLYSQTNLAIAANILQNQNLTDEDKQRASTLIQQAVDQGKSAITLNGMETMNWSNLAVIYKQLIGLVEGTADWSFQAYQQAVVLDPVNPLTRLDMGGLLFAAQRYEDAGRVFEQVVKDKPNFANGWYNLAYADKAQNKIEMAVADLQQALSLVPQDSGDYEKANAELDKWKKELEELMKKQKAAAETAQKQPETLKAPEVIPTQAPGEEEKVNVPVEEIQPPEVTPIPTQASEAETTPEALPQ